MAPGMLTASIADALIVGSGIMGFMASFVGSGSWDLVTAQDPAQRVRKPLRGTELGWVNLTAITSAGYCRCLSSESWSHARCQRQCPVMRLFRLDVRQRSAGADQRSAAIFDKFVLYESYD